MISSTRPLRFRTWKFLRVTAWKRCMAIEPANTASGSTNSTADCMMLVPTHRAPTHRGEMFLKDFIGPPGLTQRDLADAIRVPYQRVNEIVRRRRGVTPSTALRLAKFLDTSPGFWMNLQLTWDLFHAQQAEDGHLTSISPLSKSPGLAVR